MGLTYDVLCVILVSEWTSLETSYVTRFIMYQNHIIPLLNIFVLVL